MSPSTFTTSTSTTCEFWPCIRCLCRVKSTATNNISFDATDDDIKAFPQGLEIVGGNASLYTAPDTNGRINLNPSQGPIQPVQWTCPRSGDGAAWPSGSDGSEAGQADPNNVQSGTGFPHVDCDGFASPLRADIHMPSCYNPDKGLTAHTENMVYPNDEGGKYNCPQGYTHVPHMFYEIYWNTPAFNDRWTQGQGSQPFVLSTGDVAGYSSHADFMSAWDEDTLQKIIDNCDAQHAGLHTCADATENNDNQCECENEGLVDEVVNGILDALPGNKHLQGWNLPILGSGDIADDDSSSGPVGDLVDAILPGGNDEESSAEPQPTSTVAALDINHQAQADEGAATPAPVFSSEPAPEPEIQTSSAKPRVKTVWETEIVTATATELLERADPTPEGAERKRRHVHNHAARHRSNRF